MAGPYYSTHTGEEIDTAVLNIARLLLDFSAEVVARKAADTSLQNALTQEANTRGQADTGLSQSIADLNNNVLEAISLISDSILEETEFREQADSALDTKIQTEVTERTEADNFISEAISDEVDARAAADSVLTTRIAAEETARAQAILLLSNALNQEATARGLAIDNLTDTKAEKQLTNIDNATFKAKGISAGLGEAGGSSEVANRLAAPRKIALSGGVTAAGSNFDGSADITIDVTALDVSKANAGTLPVARGGTGVATMSGILKGNGANAIQTAQAGTDYVAPNGDITGNAGTATRLKDDRTINGVVFNGTSNITVADATKLPLTENTRAPIYVTSAGSATALTGTIPTGAGSLVAGTTVHLKLHVAISDGATLNLSSTGAKAILTSKGEPIKAGAVVNSIITLIYNGSNFILQGEGGGGSGGNAGRYGNDIGQISTYELMMVGNFNPYYGR